MSKIADAAGDTPASCRADLRAWAKGKSLAVRCHADIVAANLKKIEDEGMPTHPAIVATFTDNIKRLARAASAPPLMPSVREDRCE